MTLFFLQNTKEQSACDNRIERETDNKYDQITEANKIASVQLFYASVDSLMQD